MKHKAPKRRFKLNTPAADERIRRGIKSDPDTRELTAEDFAKMRPFQGIKRLPGRPKSAFHKEPITIRLDPHIVEYFRARGRGWQTEVNEALSAFVKRQMRK